MDADDTQIQFNHAGTFYGNANLVHDTTTYASPVLQLQHYLEDDDRRYGVEHQGDGVPWEYTCAYLLCADGRQFVNTPLRDAVAGVLDRFSDPDAEVIGVIATEKGRIRIDAEERVQIFEHFRWYRLGADV